MQQAAKHILVVDDEEYILELFRSLFLEDNFRVSYALCGSDAVDIIRSDTVDVLVIDKNLPDLSGIEVIRIAKEVRPLTEAIVITAYASLETVIAAMELDAFDYVPKPFPSIFALKKKIRMALEKQEMILENHRLLDHLREHAEELERSLKERKRVEAELIQSEKLAGIGTLAAGIAHEIASPLFGILGLAEAIQEEDDISLVQGYAGEIVEYSTQIRDIVQELSAYSRNANREGVTTVNLAKVIEDATRLLSRSKKTSQIDIRTEIDNELSLFARPNEIQQMLINLMKNAVDAMVEQAESRERVLTVKALPSNEDIVIRISDTGHGMSPEDLDRVFDPFFTTKEVGKGTGLGLHIVWRIIKKNGGTISVESKKGQGTTFTVRFPSQVR